MDWGGGGSQAVIFHISDWVIYIFSATYVAFIYFNNMLSNGTIQKGNENDTLVLIKSNFSRYSKCTTEGE
jgi:hypothetical protein